MGLLVSGLSVLADGSQQWVKKKPDGGAAFLGALFFRKGAA